jgi:hypothetical protein
MDEPGEWIAFAALMISVLSFIIAVLRNSPIGEVRPLEPSGFAFIRGLIMEQGIGSFPSDHLVLPMQWKNASGRPAVIQKPELILRRLEDGEETKELTFTLAGEYPEISTESFSARYSHKNSFLIEPHSVSLHTLVFHHKDFWDENSEGIRFRFGATDEYRVYVKYVRNSGLGKIEQTILELMGRYADGERTELLASSLKMRDAVNNVKDREDPNRNEDDPWWDYYEELTFD